MDLTYHPLYSTEGFGHYGAFGLKILVATNRPCDLKANAIWSAAHDAAQAIEAEVMAEVIKLDPKAQEHRIAERQQIVGLFADPLFVEEIPNGYSSGWGSRHLPWFVVTTEVGRFRIGWRKRVIHIEWTDTRGTKTAAELFPSEDVTKGERYIHAWTVEKAREYIARVIASANSVSPSGLLLSQMIDATDERDPGFDAASERDGSADYHCHT